jgi:ribosome biogenesis protein SSF1/2
VPIQQFQSRSKSKENVQSAIRLHEIGPRLQLELVKVQEGFNEGLVLYHSYSNFSQPTLNINSISSLQNQRRSRPTRTKQAR